MLPQRVEVVGTITAMAQSRNSLAQICFVQYTRCPLNLKEILVHAALWMKLEDVMLSEIKLFTEGQLYNSTYVRVPGIVKLIDSESKMIVTIDWAQGRMEG